MHATNPTLVAEIATPTANPTAAAEAMEVQLEEDMDQALPLDTAVHRIPLRNMLGLLLLLLVDTIR
jgi:hypothetical protein